MPDARCPHCKTPIPAGAAYCMTCGRATPTGLANPSHADPSHAEPPTDSNDDPEFREHLQGVLGADFALEDLIGEGGFGRVYRAADRRLGRAVAIKVIRPDLAGARVFLTRFRREGVALAKLRHPGIVPIYDIREADGLIYYIMPFIEGENLRTKLGRGRVAPKEAHRILSELCDSLAASHRAGIVHRDIKPDNVILEGFLGKVLLMDFGIAKGLEDFEATGSGILVGTPTYMSPEQASGGDTIDQRSDIYSLGVLGYHLLTGAPPFGGTTPQEVIVKHVTEEPVPLRRVQPSVPRPMADAVMRCLEKQPEDRFDSAMEFWEALQKVTFFPTSSTPEAPAPSPFSTGTVVFVWLAVLCLAFAVYPGDPLAGLTRHTYVYLAALLIGLAALVSPAAKEIEFISQPLGEAVGALWRREPKVETEQSDGDEDNAGTGDK